MFKLGIYDDSRDIETFGKYYIYFKDELECENLYGLSVPYISEIINDFKHEVLGLDIFFNNKSDVNKVLRVIKSKAKKELEDYKIELMRKYMIIGDDK